jgi:hypothetical protein
MTQRRVVLIAGMLLLFGAMCVMENRAVGERPRVPSNSQVSGAYALAGEFRVVFANLLWIKADKYHHEFIHHNPDWTKDTDVLGMLRMITSLDPTFTEAYATGVYMYAYGQKDVPRALKYLREGLANNPKSADLNRVAAIFYARHENDPETALVYAKRSQKYTTDPHDAYVIGLLVNTLEQKTGHK